MHKTSKTYSKLSSRYDILFLRLQGRDIVYTFPIDTRDIEYGLKQTKIIMHEVYANKKNSRDSSPFRCG